MRRVRNFALLIRNNWKKSVFFSGVAAFGSSVAAERIRVRHAMRAYCEEASRFGDQALGPLALPRHVTVILNPEANKRKAKVQYEKYVAPILHCAGLKVSLVTTEVRGQSKDLMEIMSGTDAVIVAGGDGTVHESVTGLLNRADGATFPLGIIPLGAVNSAAKSIHGAAPHKGSKTIREVKSIGDATLSVVSETIKKIDVLKVQADGSEKMICSINSISFGCIRDILAQVEKYWYLGNKMKPYIAMTANVLWKKFEDLATDRSLQIQFTEPCSGCSRCYEKEPVASDDKLIEVKRWWSVFIPRAKPVVSEEKAPVEQGIDYSVVHNSDCGIWQTLNQKPADDHPVNLIVKNDPNSHQAKLLLHRSDGVSKGSLILDGADVRNGLTPQGATDVIQFSDLKITFEKKPDDEVAAGGVAQSNAGEGETDEKKESSVKPPSQSSSDTKPVPAAKFSTISIDNEEYPVSSITVQRLKKRVAVYSLPYPLFRV